MNIIKRVENTHSVHMYVYMCMYTCGYVFKRNIYIYIYMNTCLQCYKTNLLIYEILLLLHFYI